MVARLGGAMAKGVTDMTCLVTDKVRRTVKFLCGVAKGVPIVTTHWLDKVCCQLVPVPEALSSLSALAPLLVSPPASVSER